MLRLALFACLCMCITTASSVPPSCDYDCRERDQFYSDSSNQAATHTPAECHNCVDGTCTNADAPFGVLCDKDTSKNATVIPYNGTAACKIVAVGSVTEGLVSGTPTGKGNTFTGYWRCK